MIQIRRVGLMDGPVLFGLRSILHLALHGQVGRAIKHRVKSASCFCRSRIARGCGIRNSDIALLRPRAVPVLLHELLTRLLVLLILLHERIELLLGILLVRHIGRRRVPRQPLSNLAKEDIVDLVNTLQLLGARLRLGLRTINTADLESPNTRLKVVQCKELLLQLCLISKDIVIKVVLELRLLHLLQVALDKLLQRLHGRIDTELAGAAEIGAAAQILLVKLDGLVVELLVDGRHRLYKILLKIPDAEVELELLEEGLKVKEVLLRQHLLRAQEA